MNCPRCSALLAENARFCGVCGAYLPSPPAGVPASDTVLTGDATLIMSQKQGQEEGAVLQQTAPAGWQNYPPQGQPLAVPPQGASWSPQAGTFQALPGAETPWQQQQVQPWTPPPQGANYQPGLAAGTLYNTGTATPTRRKKRIWLRVVLSLVIVLAVLAGAWILGLRPYLHGLAQAQLDQAINDTQGQIELLQASLPAGKQVIQATEGDLNNYLSERDTDQLQDLHMTIMPSDLELDFKAYGFSCTILAVPIAVNGALQVKDVQVQGMLGLIISNDELTTDLNSHFTSMGQQLNRKIDSITLKSHALAIQIG